MSDAPLIGSIIAATLLRSVDIEREAGYFRDERY